ncbi:hypothetical protein PHYC_02232 [Phycisphaerales bacterium]|nr:hypothetical protein PHYC_02232 [Phycisphaerales bacterium]
MAKGQHYTPYQQKIIRRFYEHRGTVLTQRLAELVTEIYLATSEKAAAKLWKSAHDTLLKSGIDPADAEDIVTNRKIQDVAAIVSAMNSTSPPPSAPRSARRADDF